MLMDDGRVYKDRVVPLEFLATTEQADKIATFALIHYDQMEVLCVPISDRVRRYRRAENKASGGAEKGTLMPTTQKDEAVTQINDLLEDNRL